MFVNNMFIGKYMEQNAQKFGAPVGAPFKEERKGSKLG